MESSTLFSPRAESGHVSHSTHNLSFCSICNKPFEKEHSRNRHIPYCRRTRNRPRIRTRPCRECSNAKAKCSMQPQCSRCAQKGLECVFQDNNFVRALEENSVTATASDTSLQPSLAEGEAFSNDVFLLGDDSVPNRSQALTEYDTEITNSLILHDASPGFCSFDALHNTSNALTFPLSQQSTASSRATHHDDQTLILGSAWTTSDDYFSTSSIPATISIFPTPSVLARLRISNPVAQNNANYIIQALRSFPQRMLRRATFPPFIHRPCPQDLDSFVVDESEPLANCMTIAQMFAARTKESTAFVWRTIRAEQQRLTVQKDQFTKAELVAAIQANIIYLIMRVVDDVPQHAEFDIQMVLAFQILCKRFWNTCDGLHYHDKQPSRVISWEDWIFDESQRRTACLWFLITRVVSVKGVRCDTSENFPTLPLPSTRSLWEANTRSSWKLEYEIDAMDENLRISTVGELIAAYQSPKNSLNSQKLDVWNAGVDTLGILLNLATAIV